MAIFGALLSLVLATGYAAADEARSWYRASKYHPVRDNRHWDDDMYDDLTSTMKENWDYDGASLFPEKLRPFLALHYGIRDLYIHSVVMQTMALNNVTSTWMRDPGEVWNRAVDAPYGLSAGRYGSEFPCMTTPGPSRYEYDFVRQTQPEDWECYVVNQQQDRSLAIAEAKRDNKVNTALVLSSVVMIVSIAAVFFSGILNEFLFSLDDFTLKAFIAVAVVCAFVPLFVVLRRRKIPITPLFWPIVVFATIAIFACD